MKQFFKKPSRDILQDVRILGIDYGSKRIGVASTDASGEFSLPVGVFPNDSKFLLQIKKIITEKQIELIIVGDSKNLKKQDNEVTYQINPFVEKIKKETGLPVTLESEIFTSAEAERLQGNSKNLDASAAALILKIYIEKNKNKL